MDATEQTQYEARLPALTAEIEQEPDQTDALSALRHPEDGTCGLCSRSGGRISEKRLEASPDAFMCVKCASGAPP